MSAFPTAKGPTTVSISSLQTTLVSRARSGKRQTRRRGAAIWNIVANWAALSPVQWKALYGFVSAQAGQFASFTWVIPGIPGSGTTPSGSWAGVPVVDGANQVGTSLNIKNLTPGATNIAVAGDVFALAGSTKVYMISQNANADGSGKATISFSGPMIASPADGAALTTSNVAFTLAFTDDQQQLAFSDMMYGSLTLNFAETW